MTKLNNPNFDKNSNTEKLQKSNFEKVLYKSNLKKKLFKLKNLNMEPNSTETHSDRKKNPAYGRNQLFRPMWIVKPIQI